MIFTTLYKAVARARCVKSKTMLVMQLTAALLLVCCLQVAATTNAQKVTLAEENAPLKKVLTQIKKQTGYTFFLNESLLRSSQAVTINVQDKPLQAVLDECFSNQPLSYQIVNKTIVISKKEERAYTPIFNAPPPVVEISGKVTEADGGAAVEGASVQVKGTARGTVTDKKGNFNITADPGAVIVISYVGFETQEIPVKQSTKLTVKLVSQSAKDPANTIVITGYQQIKKESFTGTSTTVSGEDLKKVNPQNVLRSLQVFDPSFKLVENNLLGSNPNSLPKINVRGTTALPSGSSSDLISRNNLSGNMNLPTFIMDGFEVSLQKVYDLDINRIQSITLLKDAAATAVYGSRAANGVVVIVTKPPKPGQLQMSYNYELNVSTPDLSQYNLLNATQKLDYEMMAGLYDATKNGYLGQDALTNQFYHKKELVAGGINSYWLSEPVRTALGHKHSIYVEGGDATMRYGLEARYQTMPGVMKGSYRDRYSTGLNLTYNPSRKIQFRNTLTITQTNAKESPYGSFADYVKMNPYYPKRDSSNNIPQVIDTWVAREAGVPRTHYALNPLYNSTLASFDKTRYVEIIDALSAEWGIAPSLRLRGQISLNKTATTADKYASPLSNYYFNYTANQDKERGRYELNTLDETTVDGNLTLSYNKQIVKHYINAMIGGNLRSYTANRKGVAAVGFANDRFTDIGFAYSYPENDRPSSSLDQERLAGSFFSVNYSYDNKYLMDFTFRQDGSSKFGSESRVAPFSSFGVGWNMHKEKFLLNTVVSRLKLRATTGLTGSVSFDSYKAKSIYNYNNSNWYSSGIGAQLNSFGNERLQWQKTTNYDIGAELGFLQDRIVIMPRYYTKLTKGLLADINVAPSTGVSSYTANVGDMRNKGFEINIQAAVMRTKNMQISVFGNLVHNSNTIVKISNSLQAYNDSADVKQTEGNNKGTPILRFKEGQSMDAIYAVRSLGIDPENGRELYVKADGKTLTYVWDAKDMVPVGVSTPKAEGTFGTFINYRQFGMNLTFYTRFGGKLYNQTLVDRVENADPRYNVDERVFEAKWKKAGDHTFYKNIADLGQTDVTSRFVQKDNTIELQSLYLSYDAAKPFYSQLGMRSLRFALTFNDLWRWATIKQERGIDYPFARSFTFSLQASF